jgi:uncharacterized protein with HEPN domain
MSDTALVKEILTQILTATQRIDRRFSAIRDSNDFLDSNDGLDKLDAICMMLIAIGESVKNLDKITQGQLLQKYHEIDWKGVKGMRDVISHHYFDVDAEAVFTVCKKHIPELATSLRRMIDDLQ